MAVYELLESNHPSLSAPLTEVTDSQEGREQIQQDLVDTMRAKNGIGLSANQIGIGARVFTMYEDVKKKDIIVCFNPKIVTVSEEQVLMEEGCLSYPGLWLRVRRPEGIEVTYEDVKGELQEFAMFGLAARIFQHEYDHMEGTDFTKRVSKLKLDLAKKRLRKVQKKLEWMSLNGDRVSELRRDGLSSWLPGDM